jgi:hypothetical protein
MLEMEEEHKGREEGYEAKIQNLNKSLTLKSK